MAEIADLTRHRLSKSPIEYSVVFRHDGDGMSFVVYDVQDADKDRAAVALDLERAAELLKQNLVERA